MIHLSIIVCAVAASCGLIKNKSCVIFLLAFSPSLYLSIALQRREENACSMFHCTETFIGLIHRLVILFPHE